MTTEATSRVTMIWPADLKEQLRQQVGGRGLTEYTLESIRMRLAGAEPDADTKLLVQRLFDAIATGGDYEDRAATLRSFEPIPDWIDRSDWPDWMAGVEVRTLVQSTQPQEPDDVLPPEEQTDGGDQGMRALGMCPTCHGPLIDGECWSCS